MKPLPSTQQIWAALAHIPDPEIPVINVVEMGIVRQVQVEGEKATITMTPTFSGCPALHVIREQLEAATRQLGFEQVEVKTVISPPWSTDWITAEAKEKLRQYGIAPPHPSAEVGLIQLEAEWREPSAMSETAVPGALSGLMLGLSPTRCPRCGSLNTATKNTFGPTLCKAIHVCNDCREPFERFKTV